MTETDTGLNTAMGRFPTQFAYDGSELSAHRENALQYYSGNLRHPTTQVGKSFRRAADLSDTIGWLFAGLVTGLPWPPDQVAIFQPQKPWDEPFAKQATTWSTTSSCGECDGYSVPALRHPRWPAIRQRHRQTHWWDAAPEYETLDYWD